MQRPETSTGPALALFTDLYELTMAQAFWRNGQTATAAFSLFFRSYPPDRAYYVACGLDDCLTYLENLRFSDDDLAYLRSLRLFDPAFIETLKELRFTGSVRAVPEGSIAFANEPVLEVTGPVIEAQLAETYLLNQVTLQTTLATKTSRAMHAARGKSLVDFAARRTHGTDAALKLARVAAITGFAGTSNMLAGQRYGIPVYGTMAHSFVQSFEHEADAFRAYARAFPESTTLLVDTYDSIEGVREAITLAREMARQGHKLRAVRLDSGVLADLARRSRAMLDEAGLRDVTIFASGGLDEFSVAALVNAGVPIDAFGVGTKIGVSADAPAMDSVYKLVDYGDRPVLKLSTAKATLPGPKQVWRVRDAQGAFAHDVIATASEPSPEPGAEPILQTVMAHGRRLAPSPSLATLRDHFQRQFAALPARHKALRSPERYDVRVSPALQQLQKEVAERVRR